MVAGAMASIDSQSWEGIGVPWQPEVRQNLLSQQDYVKSITKAQTAANAARQKFSENNLDEAFKNLEHAIRLISDAQSVGLSIVLAHKESQNTTHKSKHRMAESKMTQNLDQLIDAKTSPFRPWCDRLINCMSLAYPGIRSVMVDAMKVMDQKRALDKKSLLDDLSTAAVDVDQEQISEDLYAVIVDKTRNEAASKVKLVKPGDGWGALESIYLWFNAASGLAVQERLRRVMQPQSPKKIEDVPSVIESWHKEVE